MKTISLIIMSLFYMGAGANHFFSPKTYLKIMPPYLPSPLVLVYLSGLAEMGLGALLLIPAVRPWAAWGIIALLIAVLPANFYMFQQGEARFGIPNWALLLRLPLQGCLMYWAFTFTATP